MCITCINTAMPNTSAAQLKAPGVPNPGSHASDASSKATHECHSAPAVNTHTMAHCSATMTVCECQLIIGRSHTVDTTHAMHSATITHAPTAWSDEPAAALANTSEVMPTVALATTVRAA